MRHNNDMVLDLSKFAPRGDDARKHGSTLGDQSNGINASAAVGDPFYNFEDRTAVQAGLDSNTGYYQHQTKSGAFTRGISSMIGASMVYDGVANLVWGCRTQDEKTGEMRWSLKSAAYRSVETAIGAAALYVGLTGKGLPQLKSNYLSFVEKVSDRLAGSLNR